MKIYKIEINGKSVGIIHAMNEQSAFEKARFLHDVGRDEILVVTPYQEMVISA